MFIQSLIISTPTEIIRELKFHKGLNLIVDQTPETDTGTGNNVGKTTVLRLIDFCLGKDSGVIYQDPENKRGINQIVKDFLIDKKIVITITLVDDLESPTHTVEVSRNFLSGQNGFYSINGTKILKKEFERELMRYIFPEVVIEKPTFRQIISHNIRYEELRLTHTLKTLNNYTKEEEYESLYLYLFGCDYDDGEHRQSLLTKIKNEENFKKRLEKDETKSAYKAALNLINDEIEKFVIKKSTLNINPDMEKDLKELNDVKANINKISSDISALYLRRSMIMEVKDDFNNRKFNEDTNQLKLIYQQASALVPKLHKTFDDLVRFHNQMLENKAKFIVEELPRLENTIESKNKELSLLRQKERNLSEKVTKSDTFEDLEVVVKKLNELHKTKGSYESIIAQIETVEDSLKTLNEELQDIDGGLFADDFKKKIDTQLSKFNKIFSEISEQLYGERYAIKYDQVTNRGRSMYKFATIDAHFSSGKKQGEISCFDIAYTKFADQEDIPCLHFLLNDKKELVHDYQLIKLADIVNRENVQFIASILEDKLPADIKDSKYYVVELSQQDKLFRIEQQ